MVKIGDKIRTLIDWEDKFNKGDIFKVSYVNPTTNVIELEGGYGWLRPSEYEPIYSTITEELENTERYKTGSGKQLFDVLEDDLLSYIEARGFYKANIIKYTHRYKHKGGIEDLKKVKVYVDQLIKLEEKQNAI